MLTLHIRSVISRLLVAGAGLGLLASGAAGQGGLTIVVLEGDGAINNIRDHSARAPVIRVVDSGDPVEGATVNFVLPEMGAGGTFEGGHTTLSTESGPDGKATARGLRPNNVAGPFQIRVTASYMGRSASAVISQTNAAPAARGSLGKKIGIGAAVAGALVGVLVAVAGGGGASAAATSAATPGTGTVITPGSPGFGPPR